MISFLDTAGLESSSEQANVEEDEVLSQLYSTKVKYYNPKVRQILMNHNIIIVDSRIVDDIVL